MNTSVITWSFIGLIGGVPIGQAVWELVRDGEVQALDVVGERGFTALMNGVPFSPL